MKLPISALVVGYNEADLLSSSLSSLEFCDEIIYFDLGSSDNSINIALDYNANVINHSKVPGCEWIHAKYAYSTKHDWVLITDPDEVISSSLIQELKLCFEGGLLKEDIGSITVPWIFYFKKHRLKGTTWGGVNSRILLVNNKRFKFSPHVHRGRQLIDGFTNYSIDFKDLNFIAHYWMQSYRKLIEKHLRYLRNEGESRYSQGQRTSFWLIIKAPFKEFRYSFFLKEGYKDGLIGFFLSLFWALYESASQIKLRQYQNKRDESQL